MKGGDAGRVWEGARTGAFVSHIPVCVSRELRAKEGEPACLTSVAETIRYGCVFQDTQAYVTSKNTARDASLGQQDKDLLLKRFIYLLERQSNGRETER